MGYIISKKGHNALDIKISTKGHDPEKLLNSFNDCKNGRCSCPGSEYDNLEGIDISQNEDRIEIILKTKSGKTIDKNSIANCIEYTLKESSDE